MLCPAGAVHRRLRPGDRPRLPGDPLRQRGGSGGAVQAGFRPDPDGRGYALHGRNDGGGLCAQAGSGGGDRVRHQPGPVRHPGLLRQRPGLHPQAGELLFLRPAAGAGLTVREKAGGGLCHGAGEGGRAEAGGGRHLLHRAAGPPAHVPHPHRDTRLHRHPPAGGGGVGGQGLRPLQ